MKLSNLLFTLLLFVFASQISIAQDRRPEKPNLSQKSCEKVAVTFWTQVNAAPWTDVEGLSRAINTSIPILFKDVDCVRAKDSCFKVSDEVAKVLSSGRWNSRVELMQLYQQYTNSLVKKAPTCADGYILIGKTDLNTFASGK